MEQTRHSSNYVDIAVWQQKNPLLSRFTAVSRNEPSPKTDENAAGHSHGPQLRGTINQWHLYEWWL